MNDFKIMNTGYIEIIFGPMFSSKTLELISRYNKYNDIGKRCLYINSSRDNRSDSIISCNGSFEIPIPENFNGIKVDRLTNVQVEEYDVIIVDEAQLMPDLLVIVRLWAEKYNKCVIVGGLIATSEREVFGDLLQLFLFASKITQTTAICLDCISENRNIQLVWNFPAAFTSSLEAKINKVNIGGSNKYKATCQRHYLINEQKIGKSKTPLTESLNKPQINS